MRIAVGRDSRVTGEALEAAMMRGLSFERAEVMHCGLCTTPAMFMTTVLAQCDGAVMVTASHLPWQRNGYKFFTAEGGLESGDILTLLEAASFLRPDGSEQPPTEMAFLDDYTAFLSQYVRTALDDAGGRAARRPARGRRRRQRRGRILCPHAQNPGRLRGRKPVPRA